MNDIALVLQNGSYDLQFSDTDFTLDKGLETAILISLFTNSRITENQKESLGVGSQSGWWGNTLLRDASDSDGSRLWTLNRGKASIENLRLFEDYARESLQFLIDDNIVQSIGVTASYNSDLRIELSIEILRPLNQVSNYSILWDNQLNQVINNFGGVF